MRASTGFVFAALAFCGMASAQERDPVLTRIAFGSCAHQDKQQQIWDAVLGYKPELFIFAGDNVYGDERNGEDVPEAERMTTLRAAYAKAKQIPGYNALRATIPHLATWDDHDFGHDGGGDFAYKGEAQAQFLDFWNAPAADPRRAREGVYDARSFGPAGMRVQVLLLDTRYFRSALKRTDQRNAPGKERY
ncbi:MAG TPA: alkaline phosphatase D family protein, partial [Beijerinckiaceae bacterium]|nr:alkaline phosphatase D family protein [Beijerinckiaceae bacterium]